MLLKNFRVYKYLDYHERLAFHGLEILELKADLCMTYEISFTLVNLNVDNFDTVRTNKMSRGHPYTLVNHCAKFVLVTEFFACRMVDP